MNTLSESRMGSTSRERLEREIYGESLSDALRPFCARVPPCLEHRVAGDGAQRRRRREGVPRDGQADEPAGLEVHVQGRAVIAVDDRAPRHVADDLVDGRLGHGPPRGQLRERADDAVRREIVGAGRRRAELRLGSGSARESGSRASSLARVIASPLKDASPMEAPPFAVRPRGSRTRGTRRRGTRGASRCSARPGAGPWPASARA